MGLILLLKRLLSMNRKGVSATVIAIILIIVGLAILLVLIINLGKTGGKGISDVANSLDTIKGGL